MFLIVFTCSFLYFRNVIFMYLLLHKILQKYFRYVFPVKIPPRVQLVTVSGMKGSNCIRTVEHITTVLCHYLQYNTINRQTFLPIQFIFHFQCSTDNNKSRNPTTRVFEQFRFDIERNSAAH